MAANFDIRTPEVLVTQDQRGPALLAGIGDVNLSDTGAFLEGRRRAEAESTNIRTAQLAAQVEYDPKKLAQDDLKRDLENAQLDQNIQRLAIANDLDRRFGAAERSMGLATSAQNLASAKFNLSMDQQFEEQERALKMQVATEELQALKDKKASAKDEESIKNRVEYNKIMDQLSDEYRQRSSVTKPSSDYTNAQAGLAQAQAAVDNAKTDAERKRYQARLDNFKAANAGVLQSPQASPDQQRYLESSDKKIQGLVDRANHLVMLEKERNARNQAAWDKQREQESNGVSESQVVRTTAATAKEGVADRNINAVIPNVTKLGAASKNLTSEDARNEAFNSGIEVVTKYGVEEYLEEAEKAPSKVERDNAVEHALTAAVATDQIDKLPPKYRTAINSGLSIKSAARISETIDTLSSFIVGDKVRNVDEDVYDTMSSTIFSRTADAFEKNGKLPFQARPYDASPDGTQKGIKITFQNGREEFIPYASNKDIAIGKLLIETSDKIAEQYAANAQANMPKEPENKNLGVPTIKKGATPTGRLRMQYGDTKQQQIAEAQKPTIQQS